MPAPASIQDLVKTFRRFQPAYEAGDYKETEVRREFVDPLFTALSWDVANSAGKDPVSKDVVHEQSLLVEAATRMPDYSFRIAGRARFFVEAKKPSVNLKEGVKPALQIRSYSWSAHLPIGVLTDFQEFVVYECVSQPRMGQSAATSRLKYMRWDEYMDRWDELEGLLSRDAVQAGSLERAASSKVRDAVSVDDAFLAEVDSWRRNLARDLAKNNPELSSRELNYAVQQTIDRIVFLRIGEDRGIEPADQLGNLMREGQQEGRVYSELLKLFHQADRRYNSGLFQFSTEPDRTEPPDLLTPSLTISDTALNRIISRLYFPNSPYRFSVFPPDVLGHVYEQFLGKVIRLDDKRGAVIEEKPEVRKAGGVYYTPSYVVRYIVDGALENALNGRKPQQVGGERKGARPLRVLDPACGSGSFLIEVYDRLLGGTRRPTLKTRIDGLAVGLHACGKDLMGSGDSRVTSAAASSSSTSTGLILIRRRWR